MKASELVDRLRRLGGMLETTRLESTEVLQIADLIEAQAKAIEEILAALKPFAEAAEDLDERHGDYAAIWEAPAAMSIDAGDLRIAASILTSHSQKGEQG